MVIDTSVLLHVLVGEPGWENSVAFLGLQPQLVVSAASVVEAQAVLSHRTRHDASADLDALLRRLRIETLDFTAAQSKKARAAYLEFGRGSGHPAELNFGDVFSYALAKELQRPLAYVGDDFGRTDLPTLRLPNPLA